MTWSFERVLCRGVSPRDWNNAVYGDGTCPRSERKGLSACPASAKLPAY